MGCIFSLAWLISTSPILSAVPLPFMWTLCSSGIQVSFRGNYATCCCRFVVSLGRYEFKIFLCCHLEPSLSSLFPSFCISLIFFFDSLLFAFTLFTIKKQRHYFANNSPSSQGYGFSCGRVWMWELDCEESWAPKNWCFWTVVLEKTLQSPLDCKVIQPVHSKGDQSWVFFGRTDTKAETPILWPPHVKSWLIGKDSDAGRDWGQEEKRMTEDGCHPLESGWMASPTRWTWVWVNSESWWWTGRPGVLQFTGSQRVGHDWVTELNWTD